MKSSKKTDSDESLSDFDQDSVLAGPEKSLNNNKSDSLAPHPTATNLFGELEGDSKQTISNNPSTQQKGMEKSSSAVPTEDEPTNKEQENDDDDEVDFTGDADAAREELIRQRIAQSQDQMRHILVMFDQDQLKRYETFRRVGFSRGAIKKLMSRIMSTQQFHPQQHQINNNAVIVVAGVAKVFVGELVEEARRVMDEMGETGPIAPFHIVEAHRRLKAACLIPSPIIANRSNRLFK